MSKVSTELSASARNSITRVLRILANSNNSQIAEKLGLDPTTFSRFKNDKKNNGLTEIEFISSLLTAIGLKVVPESDVYCSPEIAEATRVYLAHAFTSPEYMRILFK
ncbi:transcriptional regulator [Acinetobacter baumannii]|uniref:transcriptional regulator n=1 Tax=Acinetobacter baumannii TaxID=470 RepID=UPI0002B966CD|nr:transcriptional regulator [Acinetobacter baumannii]EKT9187629.1 transcriptional regulator [Acinetobacter baumannii]EKU7981228.1 transcriptional regulator [Acinetobacter baumannii]EKU8519848.1 transcriptional regulator [Acinetobacter baumannii]EKU8700821.1 transcriptional regulator [Acinetobacter baumannii]EKV0096497.1 transcriptional regulator [Acinetobacter baumannii]